MLATATVLFVIGQLIGLSAFVSLIGAFALGTIIVFMVLTGLIGLAIGVKNRVWSKMLFRVAITTAFLLAYPLFVGLMISVFN